MNEIDPEILAIAQKRFGFETLRAGQAEVIHQVVSGRDTLAIFPTGAGKSAIYQIAGLILPGATVVISPLIALQHDQVEAIEQIDAGGAEEVNSHRTERQREAVFTKLENGNLEFVFLAPEQLANPETLHHLSATEISLFVVDEAHCISEWGHDFRPDYARLGDVVETLGHPTTLALTATAAPPVRAEIVERLHLADPGIYVYGFDRPNIRLNALRFNAVDDKRDALMELIDREQLPGIVYTATRHDAEEIAALLSERGLRSAAYHAGLGHHQRDEIHQRFSGDELDVIVATIAFGMGIDKPNVRFVIHFQISESIDSYYQEIGRSGRDGEPATATLLYLPDDLNLRRFQAASGKLESEEALKVLRAVKRANGPTNVDALAKSTRYSPTLVERALQRLEDVGSVESGTDGVIAGAEAKQAVKAADAAASMQEKHRTVARTRLEMMRQYADTSGCRRAFILGYFGEAFSPPCGNCDNCLSGRSIEVMPDEVPFPISSRVLHPVWAEGEVVRYENDTITVLFADAGYRTLSIELALEKHLLSAVTT